MFNHILIPTDGSLLSLAAAEKGLGFARDIGAKVVVMTVARPFGVLSSEKDQFSPSLGGEQHAREDAALHLTDVEMKAKALGVPYEAVLVEDEHPHRAIVDFAEKQRCDLIVMGSRGRGGLAAAVLGSETAQVLAHSRVPVLVYR